MAQRTGTLVTAPIRINDDTIQYPAVYSSEIEGGAQSDATLAARNAVPVWLRRWGMTFTVYNDGASNGRYVLKYGAFSTNLTDNQNWVPDASSAGTNVVKVDASINGSGTINIPANAILYAVMVNAAGIMTQFGVGYSAGQYDLVDQQPIGAGYTTWMKGIWLPSPTTIYFSGVTPQSVCSVIIFTF